MAFSLVATTKEKIWFYEKRKRSSKKLNTSLAKVGPHGNPVGGGAPPPVMAYDAFGIFRSTFRGKHWLFSSQPPQKRCRYTLERTRGWQLARLTRLPTKAAASGTMSQSC
jgi:hypothetical protein